jgi:hypothetical protein
VSDLLDAQNKKEEKRIAELELELKNIQEGIAIAEANPEAAMEAARTSFSAEGSLATSTSESIKPVSISPLVSKSKATEEDRSSEARQAEPSSTTAIKKPPESLDPAMVKVLKTLQDNLVNYIQSTNNQKINELRTFFGGVNRNEKVKLARGLLSAITLMQDQRVAESTIVKKLQDYLKQDETLKEQSKFGKSGRLSAAISEALKDIQKINSRHTPKL